MLLIGNFYILIIRSVHHNDIFKIYYLNNKIILDQFFQAVNIS